jgi:hypothetical protein
MLQTSSDRIYCFEMLLLPLRCHFGCHSVYRLSRVVDQGQRASEPAFSDNVRCWQVCKIVSCLFKATLCVWSFLIDKRSCWFEMALHVARLGRTTPATCPSSRQTNKHVKAVTRVPALSGAAVTAAHSCVATAGVTVLLLLPLVLLDMSLIVGLYAQHQRQQMLSTYVHEDQQRACINQCLTLPHSSFTRIASSSNCIHSSQEALYFHAAHSPAT